MDLIRQRFEARYGDEAGSQPADERIERLEAMQQVRALQHRAVDAHWTKWLAAHGHPRLRPSEVTNLLPLEALVIPVIEFDVVQDYVDRLGGTINAHGSPLHGLPFVVLRQETRFQLCETGATLESAAIGGLFGEPAVEDTPARDFCFREPFLVLLLRHGRHHPYFALWVGNAELLVPTQRPLSPADSPAALEP